MLESNLKDADLNEQGRLFDNMLEAQRRLAEAESAYYRSLLEYTLAVKNVHRDKGSLLDFNAVFLSEGPWPGKAYYDAARRDHARRKLPRVLSYVLSWPLPMTNGPYDQRIAPDDGHTWLPPVEAEEVPPLETPPPETQLPEPQVQFAPLSADFAPHAPVSVDIGEEAAGATPIELFVNETPVD